MAPYPDIRTFPLLMAGYYTKFGRCTSNGVNVNWDGVNAKGHCRLEMGSAVNPKKLPLP